MGVTLRNAILNDKAKFDLLKVLEIYQDLEAIMLKDILLTDVIIYQIQQKTI